MGGPAESSLCPESVLLPSVSMHSLSGRSGGADEDRQQRWTRRAKVKALAVVLWLWLCLACTTAMVGTKSHPPPPPP